MEVRDLMNFREDETQNNLYFGLTLGYRFNLAPRKVEELRGQLVQAVHFLDNYAKKF